MMTYMMTWCASVWCGSCIFHAFLIVNMVFTMRCYASTVCAVVLCLCMSVTCRCCIRMATHSHANNATR